MKLKIQLAISALIGFIGFTALLAFVGQHYSFILAGSLGALTSLLVLLHLISRLGSHLLNETNVLLGKQKEKSHVLDLSAFDSLQQNQKLIERKLDLTAHYIKQIDSSDTQGKMDDLLKDDAIGEALNAVRGQLQSLKEEERKRNWVNDGLARFSEILRDKTELSQYAQKIVSQLVKYLGANQAALFLEETDAPGSRYLEMIACYAYDKRKFIERRINEGEGILGQCMLEKNFVFITDVPSSYVKITSGLGEATPRNIVVAPLLFNDQFYGAVELALFEVMKPHQVEFLKRVVENIASEMASMKGYQRTQSLLNESKTLTTELQTREEEMKQNLEELAATQEEMARKQTELSGIINAIDSTLATAEFSVEGRLIRSNTLLASFLKCQESDLVNKDYTLLMRKQLTPWQQFVSGQIKSGDFETYDKKGESVWLSITFTPMVNAQQVVDKVLCMIQDITGKKSKEIEFERLSLVANNTDNSVIITDANGITEYVNEGFTKMTGFEPHEIIAAKKPVFEEILNYNKNGETYWVSLAINPVTNEEGEVVKYISIQADITDTKMRALDFHQKMKALSKSNAIMELDLQGNIIDINDNYAHLLGYEIEDLKNKPYSLITKKEHIFGKLLHEIEATGLQSGEFRRFDKTGKAHCMKLMDYPVVDLKGDLIKIIEFGVDVTKQKELERQAERKQVELTSYLSAINNTIASAEFNLEGKFMGGNDIFMTVMGFKGEELKGSHYRDIMQDEPTVHMMWDNLRLGKFFSGEFRLKNKEGRELWLTGTFNPIIVDNNVPEKIMMFAQFTTQEKEKINDLSSLVGSLKATLPIIEFNEDFSCKTANDKFMKFFGLSRTELRGKQFNDFVEEYYREVFATMKGEFLQQDHSTVLIPFHYKDKVATFESSLTVIRNLEGTIARLVFVLIRTVDDRIPVMAVV